MDAGGDRVLRSADIAVIKEVYESELAHQGFALELEKALDAKYHMIIIEPARLGDETARWISVGNCLHKTAVISALGSVTAAFVWPENLYAYVPLTAFSTICTSLYTISWQFDNCVKYQVEKDPEKLRKLQIPSDLSTESPVVLVRKDDTRRKILHCTVTLIATAVTAIKMYRLLK